MQKIEAWFADKVAKHGLKTVIVVSAIVAFLVLGGLTS